jgi:hypothetical protein
MVQGINPLLTSLKAVWATTIDSSESLGVTSAALLQGAQKAHAHKLCYDLLPALP